MPAGLVRQRHGLVRFASSGERFVKVDYFRFQRLWDQFEVDLVWKRHVRYLVLFGTGVGLIGIVYASAIPYVIFKHVEGTLHPDRPESRFKELLQKVRGDLLEELPVLIRDGVVGGCRQIWAAWRTAWRAAWRAAPDGGPPGEIVPHGGLGSRVYDIVMNRVLECLFVDDKLDQQHKRELHDQQSQHEREMQIQQYALKTVTQENERLKDANAGLMQKVDLLQKATVSTQAPSRLLLCAGFVVGGAVVLAGGQWHYRHLFRRLVFRRTRRRLRQLKTDVRELNSKLQGLNSKLQGLDTEPRELNTKLDIMQRGRKYAEQRMSKLCLEVETRMAASERFQNFRRALDSILVSIGDAIAVAVGFILGFMIYIVAPAYIYYNNPDYWYVELVLWVILGRTFVRLIDFFS